MYMIIIQDIMDKEKEMVEIWGDVVETKSLVISILVSIFTTMGMYFLAPSGNKTLGLFFGLFGAVVGFVILSVLIKPKRNINLEENKDE